MRYHIILPNILWPGKFKKRKQRYKLENGAPLIQYMFKIGLTRQGVTLLFAVFAWPAHYRCFFLAGDLLYT